MVLSETQIWKTGQQNNLKANYKKLTWMVTSDVGGRVQKVGM